MLIDLLAQQMKTNRKLLTIEDKLADSEDNVCNNSSWRRYSAFNPLTYRVKRCLTTLESDGKNA